MQTTPNLIAAIELLGSLTRGYYNLYTLTGPALAAHRQQLMQLLTGQKLPKAKCGINALEAEFTRHISADGNCLAVRRDAFEDRCREIIAGLATA